MNEPVVYRIRGWNKYFENNRTKELKKMSWFPMPTKQDGDGYTELVDHPNGAAHFGAWCAIVQLAAKCQIRGTLLRDGNIPYDAASISRVTRLKEDVFEEALPRLVSLGWLEKITQSEEGAVIPHPDAVLYSTVVSSQEGVRGRKKHSFEESPYYDKAAFAAALAGWPQDKIEYYYDSAKDGSEAKGYKYLNWIAAVKNWDRKSPYDARVKQSNSNREPEKNLRKL